MDGREGCDQLSMLYFARAVDMKRDFGESVDSTPNLGGQINAIPLH
jgi:hypothetical protein